MQASAQENDTAALDVLAALLRLLGTSALGEGAEDKRAACEEWARHVLLLTPVGGGRPPTRRDWRGLVRFASQLRRDEVQAVTAAIQLFRQAVLGLVESLRTAVSEDIVTDRALGAQLERLRAAALKDSLEELKNETLNAANVMGRALEERRRTQDEILKATGARLKELSAELDEVRAESSLDPLTKVYNRRAFDEHVAKVIALDGVFGRSACLMMVDVDHFKSVNDKHGHPVGDEVLRQLGDCLARAFPRRTDIVCRYGGEEFAIVLRDTRIADARTLATRLLASVRAIVIKRGGFGFTVSIGLAELGAMEPASGWIERADRALYAAKAGGRDRWVEAPP